MNIQLNPAIPALDKESLCYKVYVQLYNGFYDAQDKKDEAHPWGIVEGDDVSIRLHNTAYNFAIAITGAVDGSGGNNNGGVLIDYIKKAGDIMSGALRADYGFAAGHSNNTVLETYKEIGVDEEGNPIDVYGVRIKGNLDVGSTSLLIGGENVISYDRNAGTTFVSGNHVNFGKASLKSSGEFLIGESKEKGVFIGPTDILVRGYFVYHSGNANRELIDWTMKDGIVNGNLSVKGVTTLSGKLSALNGFELGIHNKACLWIDDAENIHLSGNMAFRSGYGIKIGDVPVLVRNNETDIQLGGINGDLLLGSKNTHKIRLFADLFDIDGDYALISKYGAAYLPDGITVRHNYGDELLSSYRVDGNDEGITIHKKLRFNSAHEGYLYGKDRGIVFVSSVVRDIVNEGEVKYEFQTLAKYRASTSKYQPMNRLSHSLYIDTDADFITYSKPVESKEYLGIDGSYTRLSDGHLFFTNESYLQAVTGGIKHFGNAVFMSNLSSEKFSSGFAGAGWAIIYNKTTGNIAATFDELTIRKKMRIYELEVQKISATNGSLWVSDNCSGDKVERMN